MLGGCVWMWFCGLRQPCVRVWFLTFLARGWYWWLLVACGGSAGLSCCSCVGLAAVSLDVGSPFSWSGVVLCCPSPPFLAEGFVGWVAVFGAFPPILAGGLVSVLFAGCVGCRCPLVDGGLWVVLWCPGRWGCGRMLISLLGSGGCSALPGLLLAWWSLVARDGWLLPGGGLPGGVRWVSPPWGCFAGCCGGSPSAVCVVGGV